MNIKILRQNGFREYTIDETSTLLEALKLIKQTQDATLAFASGCSSGICGSCAVKVNGKEVLSCSYKPKDGDVIEPLKNMPIIKDLVVDMDKAYEKNKKAKASLACKELKKVSQEDEKLNELQSDCILCGSCYSACPVFGVNDDFLGPFALTRSWRYVSDSREEEVASKITAIQQNGVWDCTLCNECTLVCPQNISSKQDIEKLRFKSTQFGYMDPNFANFGGGLSF